MPDPPPELPSPTVMLLHVLPGGDRHVDWLLAREPRGADPLVTFRLPGPLTAMSPGQSVVGQRLADHRPRYLTYEGPLGRGLGEVTRVASGRIVGWSDDGPSWRIETQWAGPPGRQVVLLTPVERERWRVEVAEA